MIAVRFFRTFVYAKFKGENLEKILEQNEEFPHEFFDEVDIDFRG